MRSQRFAIVSLAWTPSCWNKRRGHHRHVGLGLLIKVLAIASERRDFAGDLALVALLIHAARDKCRTLARLADEDIVIRRGFYIVWGQEARWKTATESD